LRTTEEEDNYFAERGPLQRYQNSIGCVQDLVRFIADPSVIPGTNVITGIDWLIIMMLSRDSVITFNFITVANLF